MLVITKFNELRFFADELDTSTDHAFFTHFKTGKPETEGKVGSCS